MINKIREYRIEQNITLKQLSNLTGLSIGYLCHLEKGSRTNPSYSSMNKISKALNKNIGEIFETD